MTNQNLSTIEIQSYSDRELKTKYQYEYESHKDISIIRYEALRRMVIESIESEGERKITPIPASEELFILNQQGMIGWMEEWAKFHPARLNPLNKNDKIKEIAFDDTDPDPDPDSDSDSDTDTDTDIYTLALHKGGNLPPNLQDQMEKILTHMILSTLYPLYYVSSTPTPTQTQPQTQTQYFTFAR